MAVLPRTDVSIPLLQELWHYNLNELPLPGYNPSLNWQILLQAAN
ncbi:hypothetical protein [Candidatus Uabimicrobium sp. HlEnr_7]